MGRWVVGLAIVVALIVIGFAFTLMLSQEGAPPGTDDGGGSVVEVVDGSAATGAASESAATDAVAAGTTVKEPATGSAAATDTSAAAAGGSEDVEDDGAVKIRGIVVQGDSQPIAGASLRFLAGDGRSLGTAQSDAEGQFSLRLSEPVAGAIEASAERHVTVTVPWQPPVVELEADGEADGEAATDGAVAAGEAEPASSDNGGTAADADAAGDELAGDALAGDALAGDALAGDELVQIELPFETAIAGHVTIPEDLEGTSFNITIQRYSGPYGWHEPKQVSFDGDGDYYIGDIRAATYHLWAHAHGTFRSVRLEVTVAENERRGDADFTLEPGFELTCRAYDKRSGFGVADVLVFMPKEHVPGTVDYPSRSGPVRDTVRNANSTGESGETLLRDLPPGKHVVRFLHPDFKPVDVEAVVGEGAEPIEVTLEEGTGIRGQALDETGLPMVGLLVMAVQMNPDRAMSHLTQTNVDEKGNYRIPNQLAGPYVVLAFVDPEQQPKMKFATVVASKDVVVDFVEINEFATLRGRTVDPRGTSLPAMHVTWMRTNDEGEFNFETVVSDAEGNFELRNLKIGVYMLGVGARGGGNFAVKDQFEVKAHIAYSLDLVFHDLTVEGTVVSKATEEPLANAELLLMDGEDTNRFLGRAECDERGAFRFGGLSPGAYLVYVLGLGHQPLGEAIVLKEGVAAKPMTLELELGATVQVTVTAADGSPVDGALVAVLDGTGKQVNQGLPPLTAGGKYRFGNLVPGPHIIRVSLGEQQSAATFIAKTGETHQVAVQLE